MQLVNVILIYLCIINVVAFLAFGLDKLSAVKGCWRTPEKTLLALCALGGALGGYAAMNVFRHKIRKTRFALGVPLMLLAQVALIFLLEL